MSKGKFLVLEGIDGCGKTTQLQALREWLPRSGLMPLGAKLLATREPGATALGRELRRLLLDPAQGHALVPLTELLLYAADRAQHVERIIRPSLELGHWVLCDRFTGSTAAYQGYGRGLNLGAIQDLEVIATGDLEPDLTLWLDVSPEESYRRRGCRPTDRIEGEGPEFLARVAAGYRTLAAERYWFRIDAEQPVAEVTKSCREAIRCFVEATR